MKRVSSFPRLINFFNNYIHFLPDDYYLRRQLKRLQRLMNNQEAVLYNKKFLDANLDRNERKKYIQLPEQN